MQLRKLGIKFQKIDHILISHLHGDHFFGLVGLLSTMNLMGRKTSVTIYSPAGLQEIVQLQLNAGVANLGYEIHFVVLEPDQRAVIFEDEKIQIFAFPLDHKIVTSGFRITRKTKERKLIADKVEADRVPLACYHLLKKGQVATVAGMSYHPEDYTLPGDAECSYAYCSDTQYLPTLVDDIRGVDVCYHEATFTEALRGRAETTKHATAIDAAKIARDAGVGKLLMGHISARYDDNSVHLSEARSIFPESYVVEDGDEFVLER